LLSTLRTAEVLRTLGEEADYVLVDSPPILPVTDGIVLAGIVDATILVVTANSTTKRQSQRALELLEQVSAPLIGVVLNGVEGKDGYGHSAYTYGYYGHDLSDRTHRLSRWRRPKSSPDGPLEESIHVP
jgi:Mrp family chromosome partitioning ATPase